jgi:hypothetical protein
MIKTFFIISLLMLLASCNDIPGLADNKSSNHFDQSQEQIPSDRNREQQIQTDSSSEEVPHEAFLFDANVTLTKFNAVGEEKVMKAISIIKTVIRSKEFKDRVLNFSYAGKKAFVDNGGLSNEEIYQKLLDGSEELDPGIDHEMDLDLELYYSRKKTVGYTKPDALRIWMNSKFFNVYSPSEVSGNIFHEWVHKLGFNHAFYHSVSRDSSVPYALGYLIEELGKKYE